MMSTRVRLLGRSERAVHCLAYLLDDTHEKVSFVMEEVFLHIDMETRLSAPWPEDVAAALDQRIAGARRPAVGGRRVGVDGARLTCRPVEVPTPIWVRQLTTRPRPSGQSRVMTFISLTRTSVLAPLLLAGAALTLSGCDFGVDVGDSPLGATADHRGTVIGEPVTGTVQNPDGDITVTLAPASKAKPAEGSNSSGSDVTTCTYADATYSCPTDALSTGLYRVEVTDAKFESEGTKLVTVALSDDAG